MNEMANTTNEKGLSTLDSLAMQARTLRLSININMWQLARVFTEAKALLKHGEFGPWVQENADVSERTAQDMMAAYRRFGGRPQFEGLGQAKTFKLLPLPEGTEEKFLAEHDVSAMSTREVQQAVAQARAEAMEKARADVMRERAAREAAERRAAEAESREPEIPEELRDQLAADQEAIAKHRAEAERMAEQARDMFEEQQRLQSENVALRREIKERDEMLSEQQDDLQRAQRELLDCKSAMARGDAERTPSDQITIDAFAAAVRSFIGAVARLPHMKTTFAGMTTAQKQDYTELLETVEQWVKDSRRALRATAIDGAVITDA